MVHWDQFTRAEAAELLEEPASTVRGRYARTKAELRRALGVEVADARDTTAVGNGRA